MAERPENKVVIADWPGLASNRGALIGKPGDALIQTNLHSPSPGKLEVRKGRRAITFDAATGSTGDILSIKEHRRPDVNFLVWQTADGQLIAARNPA